MPLKERYDDLLKFGAFPDAEPVNVLLMVVVAPVDIYRADTEEVREHVKAVDTFRALSDCKFMRKLDPSSISPAAHSIRLSNEIDRETTLTIDKARDPADIEQTDG